MCFTFYDHVLLDWINMRVLLLDIRAQVPELVTLKVYFNDEQLDYLYVEFCYFMSSRYLGQFFALQLW